ncbi:hypothetical protein EZY14_009080 [Kordia sp. TARA_039_SRF]|nr:hypothetical protein EZY14_009080 [Kordia sp. TARA_039_SRF]
MNDLLNRILKPKNHSEVLNPKNKNHWISMLRKLAVLDGWNTEEANAFFTLKIFKIDFDNGMLPSQVFLKYKQELEQPINQ